MNFLNERVMIVGNRSPSLEILFFEPIRQSGLDLPKYSIINNITIFNEKTLLELTEKFNPTIILFCRYLGQYAEAIINYAKYYEKPTIYFIDDDLLDVPLEYHAAAHYGYLNFKGRIEFLLRSVDLIWAGNDRLMHLLYDKYGIDTASRCFEQYATSRVKVSAENKNKKIIGYMGQCRTDLRIILPTIHALMSRRDDLQFELWTPFGVPDVLKEFGNRVKCWPHIVDFKDFMNKFNTLEWTIGLAPLAQHSFNAVRCNSKWVHYTAAGMAFIGSAGGPYEDVVDHSINGFLVKEDNDVAASDRWIGYIECLLDYPLARKAYVQNAQDKLIMNFNPYIGIRNIQNIFDRARELCNGNGT